jgi:hypothetical protein
MVSIARHTNGSTQSARLELETEVSAMTIRQEFHDVQANMAMSAGAALAPPTIETVSWPRARSCRRFRRA